MTRYRVMVGQLDHEGLDEYDGVLYADHERARQVLREAEGDPRIDIAWIDVIDILGDDDEFDRICIPLAELGEEDEDA